MNEHELLFLTPQEHALEIAKLIKEQRINLNKKQKDFAEYIVNKWKEVLSQIEDIKPNTLGDYYQDRYNKFKIALLIIPTFIPASASCEVLNKSAKDYIDDLYKMTNIKIRNKMPNFIGVIKINSPQKYIHKWLDSKQIYPFISFFIRVESV